ncbi:MAG: hypothetical protein MAG451_01986 [Anaerolineales bacterium]|nr:hypothetical protein [Anaerolineales bacterium]
MAPDQRGEWREAIAGVLQDAGQRGDGWQSEVEFFTAVLAILDGETPDLPDNHPYAQALAAIQAGIAAGGRQETDTSSAMLQAVQDFVNAEDWNASRQVVEAQQALLFRAEVETLLEQNVAQARSAGEERAAQTLELHLAVLRECQRRGIDAAFAQLDAAQQPDLPFDELRTSPFDPDIIPRTVAALQGSPQDRMQLAQHLSALARQTEDTELQAFFEAIQTALFGGDLAAQEEGLSGVYRQEWQAIRAGVEE